MWRSFKILTCVLLVSSVARASGGNDGAKPSAWEATVSNDSAAVYAGVSDTSRVVTVLKQGDSVTIKLEISSADGKWYAVMRAGETAAAGYITARPRRSQLTGANWEYQPPPSLSGTRTRSPWQSRETGVRLRQLEGENDWRIRPSSFRSLAAPCRSAPWVRLACIDVWGRSTQRRGRRFEPRRPDGALCSPSFAGSGSFLAFRRACRVATGPHINAVSFAET